MSRRVRETNAPDLAAWKTEVPDPEAVFVYAYPRKSRPFYTLPAEGNRTHAFDLLFRGLEITSGGMRINRYDEIVESAKAFGIDPAGLASVKEASLFPRDREKTRP